MRRTLGVAGFNTRFNTRFNKRTPGTRHFLFVKALGMSLALAASSVSLAAPLHPREEDFSLKMLGKFVFFDKISDPAVMSCATCHQPRTGGTGGSSQTNQTAVAITGANPHNSPNVGGLRPPSNAYATFIAPFSARPPTPAPTPENPRPRPLPNPNCGGTTGGGFSGLCGGNFWNGRAVGFGGVVQPGSTTVIDASILGTKTAYEKYLGPTADQALNPFPNPVEQNISAEGVCRHVEKSFYQLWYRLAWGERIACDSAAAVDVSFKRIAVSLAAYQSSNEINSFSSKRDTALQRELDGIDTDDTPGDFPLAGFTDQENYGHDLFYGIQSALNPQRKDARCFTCHLSDTKAMTGTGLEERYADDAYHNIGVPKNYALVNPEPVGTEGLAGHTGVANLQGQRRTPTLRNVDKRPHPAFVKAYAANGWFKSLESIVHFYNTSFFGNCVVDTAAIPPRLCDTPRDVTYEETTAFEFGVTRCPDGVGLTAAEALAANCWPAPEFARGIPTGDVGNLRLTAEDEAAIVAYMKTLTDRYSADAPLLLLLRDRK